MLAIICSINIGNYNFQKYALTGRGRCACVVVTCWFSANSWIISLVLASGNWTMSGVPSTSKRVSGSRFWVNCSPVYARFCWPKSVTMSEWETDPTQMPTCKHGEYLYTWKCVGSLTHKFSGTKWWLFRWEMQAMFVWNFEVMTQTHRYLSHDALLTFSDSHWC